MTTTQIEELNKHFDVESLLTDGQIDWFIKRGQLVATTANLTFTDAVNIVGIKLLDDPGPWEGTKPFGGTFLSPEPLIVENGWQVADRNEQVLGLKSDEYDIYRRENLPNMARIAEERGFGETFYAPICMSIRFEEDNRTKLN